MNLLQRTLALAFLLLAGTAFAQSTGTLTGRAADLATGLTLEGARITIDGTPLETFTGEGGRFSLPNVPAGTRTVRASYVGYSDVTRDIAITAGGAASADLGFNDQAVRLEEVVIEGSAVGTARAINRQRAAATLTNVVASDEIGRFPDQNAAEALQRLPGVALYRDQGEGRFIVLRGMNYTLNSVTLNGAKLSSPELGDRAIALDVLPADALSALRVTKVPTPDMDGEGLGGSVDIETRSPFETMERTLEASVQSIYSRLTGEFTPKFNATFSDVFREGTVGVLFAATFQERDFGSYNFEEDGWSEETSPTDGNDYFALSNLGFRDYAMTRTRYGASGAVEFKPTDTSHWYLRGAYTRFTDDEDRHQLYVPFERGTITALDGSSATVTGISRVRRDLRIREKDQDVFALTTGGTFESGPWTFETQANWSQATEERPDETLARFRRNAGDVGLRYAFSNPYHISFTQVSGPAINSSGFFTNLDRLEVANATGEESDYGFRFDARYDASGELPWYLKAGAAWRTKEKTSEEEVVRFSIPSSFTFANLSQGPGDYPFVSVPRLSRDRVLGAFVGQPGFTPSRQLADSTLADWESTEDVLAAYAMGGFTIGDLHTMAGVRIERTEFETRGFEVEDGSTVRPTRADRSYDNWLPGIHLRYNADERTVIRASLSRSIVRPAFAETALFRDINNDDEEITAGNPGLQELESDNFDVSLEHYLPSLGLVSVSGFYKDVSNFSYEFETGSNDPRFPDYTLTTFANGSSGYIQGVELAYQQKLSMLPAPFDGFGVLANITFIDASAEYPTRPGENLPFIGQSERVGNLALTYEKAGFFARLALNFRSERLREDEPVGGEAAEDRYVDDFAQLDLSTSYRISENWEVFGEVTNLTNEPFRVHFKTPGGGPDRLTQFEEYDWSAAFGVRWKL
jgi:TonB-dependent receptor